MLKLWSFEFSSLKKSVKLFLILLIEKSTLQIRRGIIPRGYYLKNFAFREKVFGRINGTEFHSPSSTHPWHDICGNSRHQHTFAIKQKKKEFPSLARHAFSFPSLWIVLIKSPPRFFSCRTSRATNVQANEEEIYSTTRGHKRNNIFFIYRH